MTATRPVSRPDVVGVNFQTITSFTILFLSKIPKSYCLGVKLFSSTKLVFE